ncbi:uncharacterized protein LOC122056997 [Macadamia integrifolia]|uniref:uncharacterized protein LOC122056997 n=1 Tax=Macadamia integrifolia TaxID=60698 RepID=UPI001C52EF20|nr:uncharacterized protein LOC122056997 [Macadamia integrifolia]
MRIRKYAQKCQICCLPSQLSSTYMCELNHSPWDVISFSSKRIREDDSGGEETANAVESILSLNRTWEDNNNDGSSSLLLSWSSSPPKADRLHKVEERMSFTCCNKTDGKGWKCKKEAKRGRSLCEHHLSQPKSYYTNKKSNLTSTPAIRMTMDEVRSMQMIKETLERRRRVVKSL